MMDNKTDSIEAIQERDRAVYDDSNSFNQLAELAVDLAVSNPHAADALKALAIAASEWRECDRGPNGEIMSAEDVVPVIVSAFRAVFKPNDPEPARPRLTRDSQDVRSLLADLIELPLRYAFNDDSEYFLNEDVRALKERARSIFVGRGREASVFPGFVETRIRCTECGTEFTERHLTGAGDTARACPSCGTKRAPEVLPE